ncbi:CCA tRNA nucleotidyltransferase 1 [Dirofilaria immitis]
MISEPIIPIVQKIDTPQFKALFTPELVKLNDLFKKNNFQLRMAGGAVRDLLMGIQPSDIDFATNATPDEMKELFVREEIRMLNKNGEEHGTITCRIDDKENFEITTLRIDIVCDGRRAKIEFTTNWQLDANRRDLTVNSLFLDLDGTVIDYFGGIKDLEKRRIAFVGDANQRIQEDYLRILRYFRFFGRLALDSEAHEKATLDAIISNGNGLKDISGERIWMELKKICVGRLGGAILTTMLKQCNLASLLGLPENADTTYFCNLHKRYYPKIEAMTLLSSLFTEMEQIEAFHKRCKLSYAEKTLAEFIMEHRDEAKKNVNSILFFKNILLNEERLHKFTRKKVQTSREKVIELAKYIMADGGLINELNIWVTPVFPISGIDLMNNSVPPGSHVKQILDHLFKLWIESQWMMGKEELLKHINDIEWNNEKTRLGYKRKHNFDNRAY